MKSYSDLYEKYISSENIEKSIRKASVGKRSKKSVQRRLADPKLDNEIYYYATHFRNRAHTPHLIHDGIREKIREIIVPSFDELVIQHMVVYTLMPMFTKGMYEHSYGSIPNRGAHKGKKVIEKWIRNDGKNCRWCMKLDIRKYFDSISQDILLAKLYRKIRDERFFAVVEEIIHTTPQGIPLGYYTSQWFANWYLQDFDHYVKEVLRAKHYIRYMDDLVIFGSSRNELVEMHIRIQTYLKEQLGLELNERSRIFLFNYENKGRIHGSPLDFMGFKFYRNRTILRKSIMIRISRKARKLSRKVKITIHDIRQMLSYLGWISCANVYGFYLAWVKPYVNFQYFKRRVTRFDKKGAKNESRMVQIIQYSKAA